MPSSTSPKTTRPASPSTCSPCSSRCLSCVTAGEIENYDQIAAELERLPELLPRSEARLRGQAEAFARVLAGGSDYHIIKAPETPGPRRLLRHVHPRRDAVDPDTPRSMPRTSVHGNARARGKGRQRHPLQGRRRSGRPLPTGCRNFAPNYTDRLTVLDHGGLLRCQAFSQRGARPRSPIVLATVLSASARISK